MIRTRSLVLTLFLLVGCAANAAELKLSEDHPAHPEAASTPPHSPSGTLGIAEPDQTLVGDNQQPAVEATHPVPAAFGAQVGELVRGYFSVASALARDDFEPARKAMERTQARLREVDAAPLDKTQRQQWEQIRPSLSEAIDRFLAAEGIEPARAAFKLVSEQTELAVRRFGSGGVTSMHLMHCPMAFNSGGANWLQPEAQVSNPYYGIRMLRCGELTEILASDDSVAPDAPEQTQEHIHH